MRGTMSLKFILHTSVSLFYNYKPIKTIYDHNITLYNVRQHNYIITQGNAIVFTRLDPRCIASCDTIDKIGLKMTDQ